MPKLDIALGDIQWPATCCRCGSHNFSLRTHTEKVVTQTMISATEYRQISLHNVPMCDRCKDAKYLWFGLAAVAAAIGMLILYFFPGHEQLSHLMLGTWSLAIVLAIVGTEKGPLKILKFDVETSSIKVKIYSRQVAAELAQLEAARPADAGHAQYLKMQEEKKRKQDREVIWTIRTVCVLALVFGLWLLIESDMDDGYGVVVMSLMFWLPIELRRWLAK
jgi:hypothetical protein